MGLVNNELFSKEFIEKLKGDFLNAKPYKYVSIVNFLKEEKADETLDALKKEKFFEKECDLFSLSQTDDFGSIKKGSLKEFYNYMRSEEFGLWVEQVSGIKLRIGEIDMAGTLYKACDYLLCHDDKLEGRKIAFVFYLSKNFDEKDGGSFAMFDSVEGVPGKVIKRYTPKWNSLFMFEVSRNSFHEVEENISDKNRYAIGGWFH